MFGTLARSDASDLATYAYPFHMFRISLAIEVPSLISLF